MQVPTMCSMYDVLSHLHDESSAIVELILLSADTQDMENTNVGLCIPTGSQDRSRLETKRAKCTDQVTLGKQ